MTKKVLEGGYAAFDSSGAWMPRREYLDCRVIDLPIAYSEQLSHTHTRMNKLTNKVEG